MKHVLFLLLLTTFSSAAFAQKQTKYCEVEVTYRLFKNNIGITIRTGEDKELYKSIKDRDSSFLTKGFSTRIDVVNYMAKNGWELKSYTPASGSRDANDYLLYFSKEFDKPI